MTSSAAAGSRLVRQARRAANWRQASGAAVRCLKPCVATIIVTAALTAPRATPRKDAVSREGAMPQFLGLLRLRRRKSATLMRCQLSLARTSEHNAWDTAFAAPRPTDSRRVVRLWTAPAAPMDGLAVLSVSHATTCAQCA